MRIACLLVVSSLSVAPVFAVDAPDKPTLVLDAAGHTAIVRKVLFTPDGQRLITVCEDKTIRIWDVATGQPLSVLHPPVGAGAAGMLGAAALSPDGQTLAVGGTTVTIDKTFPIYFISLANGQMDSKPLCRHGYTVLDLAFSRDGKWLASSNSAGGVLLSNVSTGKDVQTLNGHRAAVYGMAFSPDSTYLATVSDDTTGQIWSTFTGKLIAVLTGHKGRLRCVAWSPDGTTLATAGYDKSIRLWDRLGQPRKSYGNVGNGITALCFTPDSRQLLITRGGVEAKGRLDCSLLDLATGKEVAHFDSHKNTVQHGTLSRDGKLAATTGGLNNETYIWKTAVTATDREVHTLVSKGAAKWSAAWGPDNKTIAWGSLLGTSGVNAHQPLQRSFHIDTLAFGAKDPGTEFRREGTSRDTVTLVTDLAPANVVKAKLKSGKTVILKLPRDLDVVRCFTLLADNQAAVGSDFGLFLFDVQTGKIVQQFLGHTGPVWAVATSPDHRYLLSASDDQTLSIWTPTQNQPLLSLFFARSNRRWVGDWIAWTPEGYYAASPGGERMMGWQVNNGRGEMGTFHPASRFRSTLYRPDVIQLLLKEGSLALALKAADTARGRKTRQVVVADVLPPQVTISVEKVKRKLEITASTRPLGADPLTSLQLLVDERPFGGDRGLVTFAKPQTGAVKHTWKIDALAGAHNIRVLARTQASMGTSRGLVREDAPAVAAVPNLYVVCVGIDGYKNIPKLGGAVNDATMVEKVFPKESSAIFGRIETKCITEKAATHDGILAGLDWLKGRMEYKDVGVFFFAGHGYRDDSGEFYLMPVDANPKKLSNTAVSRVEIKKRMQAMPGRILVLLDACYSAAIGLLFDDLSRELTDEDCGVVVMCAARPKQPAKEKDGHGFFTRALIGGLSGKGPTNKRDGCVYLHHLQQYVIDTVMDLSDNKQHPIAVAPPWMRPFGLSKP